MRFYLFLFLLLPSLAFAWPGEFIAPNEPNVDAYQAVAPQRSGAMLSVGTFRGMMAGAAGNFQQVYLVDMDPQVIAFNKFNLRLLSDPNLGDRFDYMSKLFGRLPSAELLQDARTGKISEAAFLEALSKSPRDPNFAKLLQSEELYRYFTESDFYGLVKESNLYSGILRIQSEGGAKAWKMSPFGSNEVLEKLKTMAKKNAFQVVKGDLTKQSLYNALSKSLKAKRVRMSLIDVSNAPGWLTKKAQFSALSRGIESLPKSSDSVVLYTIQVSELHAGASQAMRSQLAGPSWTYVSTPAKQYSKNLVSGLIQINDPSGNRWYEVAQPFYLDAYETPTPLFYDVATRRGIYLHKQKDDCPFRFSALVRK